MSTVADRYEIRVLGHLGPAALASLDRMSGQHVSGQTALRVRPGRGADLLDVLRRLHLAGFEVAELRHRRPGSAITPRG